MKIRRFYGNNIRAALRQVTEEFGNDAAILSNKKVAGGVEVIAAMDYDDSLVPAVVENALPATGRKAGANQADHEISNDIQPQNIATDETKISNSAGLKEKHFKSPEDFSRDRERMADLVEFKAGDEVSYESQGASGNSHTRPRGSLAKERVEWTLDPSLQAMKEELGLMRSMMSEQLKGIGWNQFAQNNPLSAMVMRRLTRLGLDSEFLNSLLPHVNQITDAECAWQKVLALLAKSLPVGGSDVLEEGGIFAFMGPTGVGKTTTIAKLAARYVIKHGCDSIVLITTDNYRISAFEQLSTFGRILQLPTAKVNEKQSLSGLLKKYQDKKLIMIDTAGMSAADQHLISQLESLRHCGRTIYKFLLMSAASQAAVLRQSLELFNVYRPDGIIVTKLDEAASLGEILSVVTKARIQVAYTTDGQRIPEDIRLARAHHLVSKAVWLANKYQKASDDWVLAQTIEHVKSA